MSRTAKNQQGTVVTSYTLLIALAVLATTGLWGVWRFVLREETTRSSETLQTGGGTLQYEPGCAGNAENPTDLRRVTTIGPPVWSEGTSNNPQTLPDRLRGVSYQLAGTVDEARWNADFNRDGDTDDMVKPSTRAVTLALTRAGVSDHVSAVEGLRVLPPSVDATVFLTDAENPNVIVIDGLLDSGGNPIGGAPVGLNQGLEGGTVVADVGGLCWGVSVP